MGRGKFATFLRHLLTCYPSKRLLVIHDRAGQHRGPSVDAAVRDAKGRLTLWVQPAYSPEVNPAERIWKWMRRMVTHNHWFESLSAQIQAIRDFFRYLAGIRDQVQRPMRELGERKEFLSQAAHESLLALVDFAHKRTIETLGAQAVLDRLRAALAGVLSEARERSLTHSETRWSDVLASAVNTVSRPCNSRLVALRSTIFCPNPGAD